MTTTTETSPWTKKLDDALEKLGAAHLTLEELHRDLESYRDNFDPDADDRADADYAMIDWITDTVGQLKERIDMSEINSDLDLDEDKVKENLNRLNAERGAGN